MSRMKEHSYVSKTSPRTQLRKTTASLNELKDKLKATKARELRQRKQCKTLRVTLKSKLKASGLLSYDKLQTLSTRFPSIVNSIISNEYRASNTKSKVGMRYSEDMKRFASSLFYNSPKAYEFVRKHMTLPHPNTLSSWMSSHDCGPGYPLDVMRKLGENRAKDTRNMMTDVVIQFDEMAIRKETPWDSVNHRFAGFVDDGGEEYSEDAAIATNALVCLVAGISGGWKAAIGYVFTNKVDGIYMHKFATKGMELLDDHGFRVHAVISDGFAANVTMFEKFGVRESGQSQTGDKNLLPIAFEDVSSKLTNSPIATQSTYAIYDVVHMLKLWRNFLSQCKDIEWDEGKFDWGYIVKLYQLQNEEGIVAANKLTRNHLEFEKHKMKVSLATQVLSSSVADAIDFCRDGIKLEEFAGSKATSSFIRIIDRAFDILNSRDPGDRGYKEPLRKNGTGDKFLFLENTCRILLRIRFNEITNCKGKAKSVQKLVCRSNRKRCVLGLVLSIKSVIAVSKELLFREIDPFFYVCTYRFSQDLLELLFNKVRGRLGRNNNPNCIEFRNIMKCLWHQNILKSSNTGNCVMQMEESEIPGGLLPLKRRKKLVAEPIVVRELFIDEAHEVEYSQFYLNCLGYIAGNIAKVLNEKLKCESCRTVLFDGPVDKLDESVKLLITRKNRGGLAFPSQSVYKILEISDYVYQSVVKGKMPPKSNDIDRMITNAVLKQCIGQNFFPGLEVHGPVLSETDMPHYTTLISAIVNQFVRIRLFDLGKRYRSEMSVSSRHIMTKQILFSNE
jgi:hypothetical protein